MWSYAYALINQSNMMIDLLDKAELTANPIFPEDLRNRWNYYKARALTLRDGAQVKFRAEGLTGVYRLSQVPYMHATEMYLYEAEACAELGLEAEAQALLMEINLPRNPQYSCTLAGQALIGEVRLYRRIEPVKSHE